MESKTGINILKIFTKHLIRMFYRLGYKVGSHPLYFILIPLVVSLTLMTGLFYINYEDDPVVLFVPSSSPFIHEQKILEEHFPVNYTYFYSYNRISSDDGLSRIIITAKDGKSILRSYLWPEIMDLNDIIRYNISIMDEDGQIKTFEDLCAKWRGRCLGNPSLNINDIIEGFENGTQIIGYPFNIFPLIVPQLLGGNIINKTNARVLDAKAIMIGYSVEVGTAASDKRARQWESNLVHFLKHVEYDNIEVYFYPSYSLEEEVKAAMTSSLPFMPLTTFIMITSCVVLLWTNDSIRSKPLIGIIGVMSAGMAGGASFGFLLYCGSQYTRLNTIALFLVLGIGVDDIFVAIAAWKNTSINDPVPKRLAHTYADAAVAVTVTSLTNAISFAVGTTTDAFILKNFCMYCGVTIMFAYILFITFCGGFLALTGYMEEQGRHSMFFVKVKPLKENAPEFMKKLHGIFFTSNTLKKEETCDIVVKPHWLAIFFRDYVGSLLNNKKFIVFVIFSLLGYLSGAIYGLHILKSGLRRTRITLDNSYLVDFFKKEDEYFRQMPYRIQVIINGNISYSDPQTQKDILELEKKFEALPHGGDRVFTQSWLRGFLRRLRRKKSWNKEIIDEESFIRVLRQKYLNNPENPEILDVRFNKNYTRILASRITFQAANVKDIYDDIVMMKSYRQVAEESKFNASCFHLYFALFDQQSILKPIAIQSILIAIALVIVIALFFIPKAKGSLALASSILSIAVGVMGYMAYFNINLDQVSVGSIFMCIGFSVDFSAHITYTYLSSKEKSIKGKIKETMFNMGLPIVQGGLTTVLSLVTFLLIPAYGYRTFFITIFLVTIFAAYHSIILIPLFLGMLDFINEKINFKKENSISDPKNDNRANKTDFNNSENIQNRNNEISECDKNKVIKNGIVNEAFDKV